MLVWAEYVHMYRYIYTRIRKSVCLSVDASKRQVAILTRSSSGDVSNYAYRLTVHPACHEFASQFGLPFCYTRKTSKNYREDRPSRLWLLNEPATPVIMRSRLNRQRAVGAATTAVICLYLSHSHTRSYDFWIVDWLRSGQGATDRQCLLRSTAAVAYGDRSPRVVAISRTIGEYRWQEPS